MIEESASINLHQNSFAETQSLKKLLNISHDEPLALKRCDLLIFFSDVRFSPHKSYPSWHLESFILKHEIGNQLKKKVIFALATLAKTKLNRHIHVSIIKHSKIAFDYEKLLTFNKAGLCRPHYKINRGNMAKNRINNVLQFK